MSEYLSSDAAERIERAHSVNVDVCDRSCTTLVYTYTDDSDRLGFEFDSMNPRTADVETVADAINQLRTVANRRPRVGKPNSWV